MISCFRPVNSGRRAFAVLEYVMMIIILAAGLYAFRNYIQRGFQGQYRKAGESFGFTRQYNPGASRDCAFDADLKIWYVQGCFNNQVVSLGCARKSSASVPPAPSEYDGCMDQARTACTAGCDFQ